MVVFAKQSMLCTERKLLSKIIEYFSLNEETEGTIIMFIILPPCGDYDFLIENFRKKYKNINLSVFDYSQYLNDDIKPEGKVEPEPINVPEIIKTLEDLKSANPNYGLDCYTSIDDVLKNAISLAEELKTKETKNMEFVTIYNVKFRNHREFQRTKYYISLFFVR
ncbi:hypothetical protein NDK43_26565 [Neobacillus pocheonensis]|uniref:Uncharacterized protein n=1 Tax=Neobacillus pocheonensis TaxID=363869 RepID=A0ABT0WIE5_9BACI|nr:hypothetical protein [Neobacillus pocheonensis]